MGTHFNVLAWRIPGTGEPGGPHRVYGVAQSRTRLKRLSSSSSVYTGWGSMSGLPCSFPENLPHPGIKPRSLTLQVDSLPSEPPGKPFRVYICRCYFLHSSHSLLPPLCPCIFFLYGIFIYFHIIYNKFKTFISYILKKKTWKLLLGRRFLISFL